MGDEAYVIHSYRVRREKAKEHALTDQRDLCAMQKRYSYKLGKGRNLSNAMTLPKVCDRQRIEDDDGESDSLVLYCEEKYSRTEGFYTLAGSWIGG